LLADAIGYREGLWLAAAGFVVTALAIGLTPMRDARTERDAAQSGP
jgi:predicted outer membrane lipoprotein